MRTRMSRLDLFQKLHGVVPRRHDLYRRKKISLTRRFKPIARIIWHESISSRVRGKIDLPDFPTFLRHNAQHRDVLRRKWIIAQLPVINGSRNNMATRAELAFNSSEILKAN